MKVFGLFFFLKTFFSHLWRHNNAVNVILPYAILFHRKAVMSQRFLHHIIKLMDGFPLYVNGTLPTGNSVVSRAEDFMLKAGFGILALLH